MDGHTFDTLTRNFAMRLSRRQLLGLLGIGAAATALPPALGGQTASAASDASSLVVQFYELVDAYQYADAYVLLGSKWHGQQSQSNFTHGYANTAFVQCRTTGETKSGGNTVVGVKLISWHNDGNIVAYTGSYTVGMEKGKPTILTGNNKVTAVPSGTPPLCKIDDLTFGFGWWQGAAGSTIGSVVAKNKSHHTCVVGGSPRITLTDSKGHVLVSTSQAGSEPTAITLEPGARAQAPVRFSNWCGSTGEPASIRAEVPGDIEHTKSVSNKAHAIAYPPCNGPGQPAFMQVRGWEKI